MYLKDSAEYWEQRYRSGRTSGRGSYGKLAEFKAGVINTFVEKNQIQSVIDFGCGDGNQLGLFEFPVYLGLDVSKEAIKLCSEKYKDDATKRFLLVEHPGYSNDRAELALSLDVIYHLVEDDVYLAYMGTLFRGAQKFVIIYSSNFEKFTAAHEREREFTSYVTATFPQWQLVEKIANPWPLSKYPNGSLANFYVYERRGDA